MTTILLAFAFVFFVLGALVYSNAGPWWGRLISAGLACWVAVELFGKWGR